MINSSKPMKPIKLLLAILAVASASAQTLSGKIAPVEAEGLHSIMLPREIRSHSSPDLRDLRIFDGKKKEVPYFINDGTGKNTSEQFIEYPIVDRKTEGKTSSYTIDVGGRKLYGLSLTMNNSDTEKLYDLSGSNDLTAWFGISNRNVLARMADGRQTTVTTNISFPLSAYRYLKLTLHDSLSLPINIVRAGNMKVEPALRREINFNAKVLDIAQFKTEKKTVVKVAFANREIIDKIMFVIDGPKYYRRHVTVYQKARRKYRRKWQEYEKVLCEFELSSENIPFATVPQFCEKEFYIRIDNRDNQPLGIRQVSFAQNAVFAVADLKPGENYTVETGNRKLDFPDYDLSGLDINVHSLPAAYIGKLQPVTRPTAKAKSAASLWQQPWFLWLCIGVGAVAIAYFTTSLVKDMKRE